MAFSWHKHCLCRVGAWSRTSHAQWTADVRNLTGNQWDAAVEQFSLLFFLWLLSGKTGAENSQNLHQIVELISRIEGLLQSWSSTPLQVTSVCAGIFQIFVVCWSKGSIVDKQVDIVKVQLTWTQSGQTDPHWRCPWLFCFCGLVTSKMSNGVNKSCIRSACSCSRRLRVWGRSKFTKHNLTLQEKALHFFLLSQPLHASCGSPGDLDLVATFIELSLGCSDCCV